jgi:hypothetical protein
METTLSRVSEVGETKSNRSTSPTSANSESDLTTTANRPSSSSSSNIVHKLPLTASVSSPVHVSAALTVITTVTSPPVTTQQPDVKSSAAKKNGGKKQEKQNSNPLYKKNQPPPSTSNNNKKIKADQYERHQKYHNAHEAEFTSQDSFLKKFSLLHHTQQPVDPSSQRTNSEMVDAVTKERSNAAIAAAASTNTLASGSGAATTSSTPTNNPLRKTKSSTPTLPLPLAKHVYSSPATVAKRLATHETHAEDEESSLGPSSFPKSNPISNEEEQTHMLESPTTRFDLSHDQETASSHPAGNRRVSGGQQRNKNSSIRRFPMSLFRKSVNKSLTGTGNSSSLASSSSSLNNSSSKKDSGSVTKSRSMLKSFLNRVLIKCNFFVLSPDDNTTFIWLIVLTMCVLYNIWLIIARQSFEKLQIFYREYWIIADYVVDTIYALDVLIQFRTGYLEQGLLVYNSKKLAVNYSRSGSFLLDVLSLTPLEVLQWWLEYDLPILRFPRFFKFYRAIDFYYMTESRTLYPNVWRVANLTHILFLLGHWFAGFYFLISKAEGFKGHWSYPPPVDEFAQLPRMYLRSLYWSTLTLTTIGDLPPPETNWQ